jgi:hypothetical protein
MEKDPGSDLRDPTEDVQPQEAVTLTEGELRDARNLLGKGQVDASALNKVQSEEEFDSLVYRYWKKIITRNHKTIRFVSGALIRPGYFCERNFKLEGRTHVQSER